MLRTSAGGGATNCELFYSLFYVGCICVCDLNMHITRYPMAINSESARMVIVQLNAVLEQATPFKLLGHEQLTQVRAGIDTLIKIDDHIFERDHLALGDHAASYYVLWHESVRVLAKARTEWLDERLPARMGKFGSREAAIVAAALNSLEKSGWLHVIDNPQPLRPEYLAEIHASIAATRSKLAPKLSSAAKEFTPVVVAPPSQPEHKRPPPLVVEDGPAPPLQTQPVMMHAQPQFVPPHVAWQRGTPHGPAPLLPTPQRAELLPPTAFMPPHFQQFVRHPHQQMQWRPRAYSGGRPPRPN